MMFDGILNVTLSEEKVSTTGVTQGNLALFLCPNYLDLQQTQIQAYEISQQTLLFSKLTSRRLEGAFRVALFRFPRCLEDVFKTYLQYVFLKRLQDVFKTSSET